MENEKVLEVWRISYYKIIYLWIKKKIPKWKVSFHHQRACQQYGIFHSFHCIDPNTPTLVLQPSGLLQYRVRGPKGLGFRDPRAHTHNSGIYVNRKEKNTSLFLLPSAWASLSIMMKRKTNKQKTTIILAIPVTWSPMYLKILFIFNTTLKSWLFLDPTSNHII